MLDVLHSRVSTANARLLRQSEKEFQALCVLVLEVLSMLDMLRVLEMLHVTNGFNASNGTSAVSLRSSARISVASPVFFYRG